MPRFDQVMEFLVTASLSIPLLACSSVGSAADIEDDATPVVQQIIVRYEARSPVVTGTGDPWGAQCVDSEYHDRIHSGRWIGARMRVLDVHPSVSESVGQALADQLTQCPHIEWAEADTVRYSLSGQHFSA